MESSREDSSDSDVEKRKSASSSAYIADAFNISLIDLQKNLHPDYLDEKTDPLKAAEQTGPRVYTLKNHNHENVRFFVFGCQGDKKRGQAEVATYIKKLMAERPDLKPDFIVLLGDNFYPNGVDSPEDQRFIEQFYKLYGIPCFVVPGNHDFGFTNEEKVNYGAATAAGKARGMHQVTHSYELHAYDPLITMSKPKFWRQSELDLALLPRWCMPWLFYSVIVGNLQLFFMDSNHIADDYLNYTEDIVANPRNQVAWLVKEFKACKNAGRTPLLFQHHPFVNLSDRERYGNGDAHLYFKDDINRWKRLAEKFDLDVNSYQYDVLLSKIYASLGIKFAANFSAHVHAMYNVVTPEICQFVVGTGGGKLQERACFKNDENTGFFLQELGLMAFSCNKKSPKIMNLTALTVSGREIALTNARARPFTDIKDSDTAELYKIILQACHEQAVEYAAEIELADKARKTSLKAFIFSKLTKVSHLFDDVALTDASEMHNIIAHFCKPTLVDFQTEIQILKEFMEKLSLKTENSFYGKINKAMKQSRFKKTVQELTDVNVASKNTISPVLSSTGLKMSL